MSKIQEFYFETWADLNYRIGKNPAAIGASAHILYVGKKPEERP